MSAPGRRCQNVSDCVGISNARSANATNSTPTAMVPNWMPRASSRSFMGLGPSLYLRSPGRRSRPGLVAAPECAPDPRFMTLGPVKWMTLSRPKAQAARIYCKACACPPSPGVCLIAAARVARSRSSSPCCSPPWSRCCSRSIDGGRLMAYARDAVPGDDRGRAGAPHACRRRGAGRSRHRGRDAAPMLAAGSASRRSAARPRASSWPKDPGAQVTVTAQYTFTPGFFTVLAKTLSQTSRVVCE